MDEIKHMDEADKIMEIPISYEEKGMKKGIEKGKGIGVREVALEMLKRGLTVEFLAEVTNLERKEIEELRKHL